ncbi:crossover junction endodeoxyribonuclease RuvC [Candidatus Dojkabacteria bacterium]|jgi:crossover junction endodeoxyribonuclease RuvC|nr:crossover junction endodeoxyribonuclease RuvC [Candidatus Dojkabacteria bacterium]
MRVLGIDVGFAINGWSILDKDPQYTNGIHLIDYGAILTEAGTPFELRLRQIFDGLDKIIKEYKPSDIAIESLFYFKNQKTVINVSQVRGVILLVAQLNNLNIYDYTPLQVKTSVTGYGRAEKRQIQQMVKMIFGLKEIPKPDDIADAIAVSYCHINSIRPTQLKSI